VHADILGSGSAILRGGVLTKPKRLGILATNTCKLAFAVDNLSFRSNEEHTEVRTARRDDGGSVSGARYRDRVSALSLLALHNNDTAYRWR